MKLQIIPDFQKQFLLDSIYNSDTYCKVWPRGFKGPLPQFFYYADLKCLVTKHEVSEYEAGITMIACDTKGVIAASLNGTMLFIPYDKPSPVCLL